MAMSISSVGSTQAAAAAKTATKAAQASTKTISTDPRDLNKDGVVTEAEIQAYNLTHGIQAAGASSQSTGQGSSQTTAAATPKVDLLA